MHAQVGGVKLITVHCFDLLLYLLGRSLFLLGRLQTVRFPKRKRYLYLTAESNFRRAPRRAGSRRLSESNGDRERSRSSIIIDFVKVPIYRHFDVMTARNFKVARASVK